jgi:hypothetical protein
MFGDDELCVCDENSAYVEELGCVPCGEHEIPGASGCECAPGYQRSGPAAACEALPAGQGVACNATDMPCTDAEYGVCQMVDATHGYCTSTGCSSSDDCEGDYACDTAASPAVCIRPPVGQGQSCASAEDCAGTEATYCDTFVNQACLVQGCSLDPDDCFPGWECCDLSAFGVAEPICIPEGDCQP